jgi:hypothetical protein
MGHADLVGEKRGFYALQPLADEKNGALSRPVN